MKILNLSSTRVFKAISEIKNLTQLVDLNLEYTKVTPGAIIDISKSLNRLKRFKSIFYEDRKFNSVYYNLPDSLESLELDELPYGAPSAGFSHLTALQRLDLFSERNYDWNVSIENLTRLTRIRVQARLSGTLDYDWSKVRYLRCYSWDSEEHTTKLVNCTRVEVPFADPANLTNLTNLHALRLREDTENVLDVLQKISNLKKIRCYENNEESVARIALFEKLGIIKLAALDLHPSFTTLTTLENLRLAGNEDIDIGYGLLTNLTALQSKRVRWDQIACLPNLRKLDICYNTKPVQLELLTSLTNLTYLNIEKLAFSAANFDAMANSLTNLKTLFIRNVKNTGDLIPSLAKLKRLHTLFITYTSSNTALATLSELPSLKRLHMTPGAQTDNFLVLLQSPSLCTFWLGGQYTDDFVEKFAKCGIHIYE